MVVRKKVLEYIIALVVVKNKVRLKRCLKKFQRLVRPPWIRPWGINSETY
jgi:hypothetical protein